MFFFFFFFRALSRAWEAPCNGDLSNKYKMFLRYIYIYSWFMIAKFVSFTWLPVRLMRGHLTNKYSWGETKPTYEIWCALNKKTWFFVTTAGTIKTIITLIISNITGLVYRKFYRQPPMILMLKTMVSGVQFSRFQSPIHWTFNGIEQNIPWGAAIKNRELFNDTHLLLWNTMDRD
jgi:hypothetical protein